MPPQQQNYPNQQMQPIPGPQVPYQGPNIFAPPPPGGQPPKPHKLSKLPIVLAILFLLTTITFAALAFKYYGEMTSYRDDYQAKAAKDVAKAKEEQKQLLEAEFAEKEKSPTRTYQTQASAASVKNCLP
jgi:hypothetical protein